MFYCLWSEVHCFEIDPCMKCSLSVIVFIEWNMLLGKIENKIQGLTLKAQEEYTSYIKAVCCCLAVTYRCPVMQNCCLALPFVALQSYSVIALQCSIITVEFSSLAVLSVCSIVASQYRCPLPAIRSFLLSGFTDYASTHHLFLNILPFHLYHLTCLKLAIHRLYQLNCQLYPITIIDIAKSFLHL